MMDTSSTHRRAHKTVRHHRGRRYHGRRHRRQVRKTRRN